MASTEVFGSVGNEVLFLLSNRIVIILVSVVDNVEGFLCDAMGNHLYTSASREEYC
jgi:hypothetical protein